MVLGDLLRPSPHAEKRTRNLDFTQLKCPCLTALAKVCKQVPLLAPSSNSTFPGDSCFDHIEKFCPLYGLHHCSTAFLSVIPMDLVALGIQRCTEYGTPVRHKSPHLREDPPCRGGRGVSGTMSRTPWNGEELWLEWFFLPLITRMKLSWLLTCLPPPFPKCLRVPQPQPSFFPGDQIPIIHSSPFH